MGKCRMTDFTVKDDPTNRVAIGYTNPYIPTATTWIERDLVAFIEKNAIRDFVPLVRSVVFASQYLDRTQLLIAVKELSLKVDPANKGVPGGFPDERDRIVVDHEGDF